MNMSRKLEYNKKGTLNIGVFKCLPLNLLVHYLIRDGAVLIISYTITSKKNIIIVSIKINASFLLI